jgi:hypothetical protein
MEAASATNAPRMADTIEFLHTVMAGNECESYDVRVTILGTERVHG